MSLFVRNLPFSCTPQQLYDSFVVYGKVKKCFVTRDKGAVDRCRGIGYVTFENDDDALRATKGDVELEGRRILVHWARDKKENKADSVQNCYSIKSNATNASKVSSNNTLVLVRVKDSFETLKQKLKDLNGLFQVRKIVDAVESKTVVTDYKVHLFFTSHKDAVKALNKLKMGHLKGTASDVVLLSTLNKKLGINYSDDHSAPAKTNQEHGKLPKENSLAKSSQETKNDQGFNGTVIKSTGKPRLVIRNLPFNCRLRHLKASFSKFGKIVDTNILKKNGKMTGCAFVEFDNVAQARKALKHMNGTKINERPVAVDWAVAKSRYDAETKRSDSATVEMSVKGTAESIEDDGDGNDDDADESDDGDNDDADNNDYNGDDDVDGDNSDDDDASNCDDDNADNSDDDDKSNDNEMPQFVDDGQTIFIRNLPFDLVDESLLDLCKQFGPVHYVTLCYDAVLARPKGTAFARFYRKESAEKMIEKSKNLDDPLLIDGRKVEVLAALARGVAKNVEEERKMKEVKDNRNLHLIREGLVRAGTKVAEGTPPADLKKREALMAWKKQRLKNLNYFVSPTRLCVRNLPLSVDDKMLRQISLKSVGDRSARVTESRVMRDLSRLNVEGIGRSKRFGFVTFTQHEHALAALHNMDNNPEVFGENQRLIVEFSVENKEALNKKKRREERSRGKVERREGKEEKREGKEEKREVKERPRVSGHKQGVNVKHRGLPSHLGPKIRHRDHGKMKLKQGKMERGGEGKSGEEGNGGEKKKKKRNRKRNRSHPIGDDFDQLVQKHKATLAGGRSERAKWYEM